MFSVVLYAHFKQTKTGRCRVLLRDDQLQPLIIEVPGRFKCLAGFIAQRKIRIESLAKGSAEPKEVTQYQFLGSFLDNIVVLPMLKSFNRSREGYQL
jgi:hypothetical protein